MNPARSLGPAIAASDYTGVWVYLVAPLAGATIAPVAYQFHRAEERRHAVTDDEIQEAA